MNTEKVTHDLQTAASHDDFIERFQSITDQWSREGDAVDAVEPVLRFMEDNPRIDFGTPGPLVHFVEQFYGHGYESRLIESLNRRPTEHTVWMLNRIINGTDDPLQQENLRRFMADLKERPETDPQTRAAIEFLLE